MTKVYSKLFSFSRFAGMNNVDMAFRKPSVRDQHWNVLSDMETIENLDIDNLMVLSTRNGSDLKLSGTSVHSLWSNDHDICFYVDGDKLYQLQTDYTGILIATVGTHRMSYVQWDDKLYMTNGQTIGYVKDYTFHSLTAPSKNYKLPLPAGKFITYYRGRLYVAKNEVLYISDALCHHFDIRNGFRVFENDITMIVPVEKGIYVSDGKTWFMSGATPKETRLENVNFSKAIAYTAKSISSDGIPNQCAMWTAEDGIWFGDGGGMAKNLTAERFHMPTCSIGGSTVRNINEVEHYITILE